MKFSRMLAVGAATALVGVSTLAIGGTASAADFYVNDTQFPAETSPYSPGWFTGGGSTGTIDSTPSGLLVDGTTGLYQILNGTTPTTDILGLVNGAEMTMASGNAIFQIPVFYDHDQNPATNPRFTTLRPDGFNQAGIDGANWVSSWNIVSADGTTVVVPADTSTPLTTIVTALQANYEILAFGAYVNAGTTATIVSITWAGNTHWFLPAAPTAAITPASLTIAAMGTTGVSGVFTGFIPGEAVEGGFGNGGSGGAIPGSFTADANGSVTIPYSEASLVAGTYFLGAFGLSSGVSTSGSFAVTANPATLAATGTDFTPAIAGGGVMLLLGTGLVLAGRRRAAAHRR
ncbi:hypothetical protein [Homoserinimonas sp. A520]